MEVLVQHEVAQLLAIERCDERRAVLLVTAIGSGSGHVFHHLGLAHHDGTTEQGVLRVSHAVNVARLHSLSESHFLERHSASPVVLQIL